MKRLIRWTIILGVLGGIGALAAGPMAVYLQERQRVHYREAAVTRGNIVAVVNATGTIKPVRLVQVGSFVSGPILEIYADHNAEVKKGDVLAKIDPQIYDAYVKRDQATLATQEAAVQRCDANLQQAINNDKRARALRAENRSFISDQEMDQYKFNRLSLAADLVVAQKSVDQAKANLDQSEANLGYTTIRAPVDGIVIDRKIDPGQTVAAQFQTPELFVVAPDMHKEIHVFASVDEADIGLITQAKENDQPVRFTVDAWPDDLFEGKIYQIRMNATTTQNVVTYPVVVTTANPDLKLKPAMTATLSFQIRAVTDVLRVPNAALRFYPQREQVRTEDRDILENKTPTAGETDEHTSGSASAMDKAELRRKRNRRHVWVRDGDLLRAVEVTVGISSNQYSEVVSGELKEGDQVVTGVETKK
jgi:HlyD family secretion protein